MDLGLSHAWDMILSIICMDEMSMRRKLNGWQRLWVVATIVWGLTMVVLWENNLPPREMDLDFELLLNPEPTVERYEMEKQRLGNRPHASYFTFDVYYASAIKAREGIKRDAVVFRESYPKRLAMFSAGAFLLWLLGSVALWVAGWFVAWVRKGFEQP